MKRFAALKAAASRIARRDQQNPLLSNLASKNLRALLLGIVSAFALSTVSPSAYAGNQNVLFLGVQGIADELLLTEQTVLPGQSEIRTQRYGSVFAAPVFDLLQYMRKNVDPRKPDEILAALPRYHRLATFGGWVNDNPAHDCYNTRVEILIRDVADPKSLVFVKDNPCNIARGEWNDPYTGTDFKLASAVQIDHFIPLRHAYQSGAHSWTKERRCHYTNYMGNRFHLLTVSGHENMSKCAKSPTEYLPPDESYVCQYLAQWLKIKAIWNLSYTDDERLKIETELSSRECPTELGKMSVIEIQDQRRASVEINEGCK